MESSMKSPIPQFNTRDWIRKHYTHSDVCFVLMPLVSLERPSIGLGLLNATVKSAGISSRVIYGNLLFGELTGNSEYAFADYYPAQYMLGEWLFSQSLFPDFEGNSIENYYKLNFREIENPNQAFREKRKNLLAELRNKANLFIEEMAQAIIELNPRIVGCSTVFQQTNASLALLRRIKQLNPDMVTLIGGSNCEGIFGKTIMQNFDFVDYAVSGEADDLIVDLVKIITEKGPGIKQSELPYGTLGSEFRDKSSRYFTLPENEIPRATVLDLNHLPVPDYSDFNLTVGNISIGKELITGYLAETARGCWWGNHHQCTFCGLNGFGLKFRSKSPQNALLHFASIASENQTTRIEVVDNIIDMSYFKNLMPQLAALGKPYSLFYETKANLKPSHFKQMNDAGISWTQPGLESLSNPVLNLMNKGTDAITNITHLKFARKNGIRVSWNFLFGFPGEKPEWYEEIEPLIPLLSHLQPPNKFNPIRFNRYSYYFDNQHVSDLKLRPFTATRYIYPFPDETIANLSVFFVDPDFHKTIQHDVYTRVHNAIELWIRQSGSVFKPMLSYNRVDAETIEVLDLRPAAEKNIIILTGAEAEVFVIQDTGIDRNGIIQQFKNLTGTDISGETLEKILNRLKKLKLIIEIDQKLLNLAIEGSCEVQQDLENFPGGKNISSAETVRQFWDSGITSKS
ncbi:MAG: RiPP maturation radical SAM C-methyltransferase [Bacteroidales bacterium]|nr:RiPP maturation radical SAM C-methyltransferase [Bacteroidales bacterium]